MNPFEGYRVSSPFGWRTSPISGKREFHTGIDLVKPHQSPIYAFTGGTVTHAKDGVDGSGFGGYGIVVAVRDAATDNLHVYAHLDSVTVKVGQQVERGQMIGRLGTTGQSTGPHLHYEIRKTSAPQHGWIAERENNCFEPTQYLIDYCAARERKVDGMELEQDWQWKMLGDALDGLYHKGLISDYSWAEKAYNRKLTQSEMAWLNAIMFARQNGITVGGE